MLDYLLARGVDVERAVQERFHPVDDGRTDRPRADIVRLLLSKGADARIKAPNGGTRIALSLKCGDATITQALKDAGATE